MTTPPDSSATSLSQLAERRLLVCTSCRGPLTWRAEPNWLASLNAGQNVESPATRPAGALATSPSAALCCQSPDCRRVYLVWDGIPNMLAPEAARLTSVP
ncbi:MAG: Trm112 family protein [Planctomycetaceae bacterium]